MKSNCTLQIRPEYTCKLCKATFFGINQQIRELYLLFSLVEKRNTSLERLVNDAIKKLEYNGHVDLIACRKCNGVDCIEMSGHLMNKPPMIIVDLSYVSGSRSNLS